MDLYKEKNLKPMLLTEIDLPFNDNNYLFEIKFDGIRAIIYVNKKEITIKTRNGIIINEKFPELLELKKIFNKKCILDGEIVLMENGLPSFSKLHERLVLKNKNKINELKEELPVTFVCFDILYEEIPLFDLPLVKRKKILSKYKDTDFFVKSRVTENNGKKLFSIIKKKNIEGIVAKKKDSIYIPNSRSKEWIKIKNLKEEDYYICGYKEEEKVLSLLLGEKKDNKLEYISKVVMGKKKKDYKLITDCPIIKNRFKNFNEKDYIFIKPKYKCTIKFLEKTKNNSLRHPIYKGIRID